MALEELPALVEQQLVENGLQHTAFGQPEFTPDPVELGRERRIPTARVDLDPTPGDLPGVAHRAVMQCLVPQTEGCRAGHPAELLGLRGRDRESQSAYAAHFDAQVGGRGGASCGESCGRFRSLEPGELFGDEVEANHPQMIGWPRAPVQSREAVGRLRAVHRLARGRSWAIRDWYARQDSNL